MDEMEGGGQEGCSLIRKMGGLFLRMVRNWTVG